MRGLNNMGLSPKLMKKLAKHGFTLEQIDYIDKEVYMDFKRENDYKIMCGRTCKLIRRFKNGKNVYYIMIVGKNQSYFYREVNFYQCESPDYDNCFIVIHQLHESYSRKNNVYQNKLIIKDYDLVVDGEIERINAIRKFISDIDDPKNKASFYQLEKM
jgi:hypothetical protein